MKISDILQLSPLVVLSTPISGDDSPGATALTAGNINLIMHNHKNCT